MHDALQLSVLSSPSHSSRGFASVIWNIGKFGAKNYFTAHRTGNTIYGFRDLVPVLKIRDCYLKYMTVISIRKNW